MEHDHDFLQGIDEEFERRMKLFGKGAVNGSSSSRRRDSLSLRILELLESLTTAQKEETIHYIQSLKDAPATKTVSGSSGHSSE